MFIKTEYFRLWNSLCSKVQILFLECCDDGKFYKFTDYREYTSRRRKSDARKSFDNEVKEDKKFSGHVFEAHDIL